MVASPRSSDTRRHRHRLAPSSPIGRRRTPTGGRAGLGRCGFRHTVHCSEGLRRSRRVPEGPLRRHPFRKPMGIARECIVQNRYVADEGDFAKFGLLRALAGVYPLDESPSSLGVVWYRPDIETGSPGDGSKRNHLNDPQQRYRRCDPELFDSLKSISATNRSVNAIKESGILGDSRACFYNNEIQTPQRDWSRSQREDARATWWGEALERVGGRQIMFLDPDNGLAPNSVPIRHKRAMKYAYLQEVASLVTAARQPVIVIYHHLGRSFDGRPAKQPEQMRSWAARLNRELRLDAEPQILWHRGETARAYFVLFPSDHDRTATVRGRLNRFRDSLWFQHGHFASLPLR